MDLPQLITLLGSLAVLIGLLKAHHVVVERHVLPSIEPDDERDE